MLFLLMYCFWGGPASLASAAEWQGTPAIFQLADLGGSDSSCAIRYEIDARSVLCLRAGRWRQALNESWGCPTRFQGEWKEVRTAGADPAAARTYRQFLVKDWRTQACDSGWVALIRLLERERFAWSMRLALVDSFGILRHLLLSQKVPERFRVPWRELGFVHLLTLTGIHLYALAAAVDRGVGLVFAAYPAQVAVAKRGARILSLLVWLFTWLMSGARAGLLRPGWVVLLHWSAAGSGRRWRRYSAVGLALFFDALWAAALPAFDERWEQFALGRAHYGLAVVGGLFGASLTAKQAAWRQHAAMAIASWLAVVPLDLMEHGMVAPLTPALSVVTIPWVANVVTPLLLVTLPLGWDSLVRSLAGLNDFILVQLVEVVRATNAVWLLSPAALGAGFFLAVLISFRRARIFLAAGGMATLLWIFWPPPPALLRQWNVGQGDAALARFTNGRAWVLDAGPAFSASPTQWMHRLSKAGVGRADRVVLSHLDEDHRGGLAALVAWVRVDGGIVRPELLGEVRRQYESVQWYPSLEIPAGWTWIVPPLSRAANGQMLGWSWLVGERRYLNLGDAPEASERAVEAELARLPGREWIWKLSHHGSRTSTPAQWFARFPIREVWVSAGHANRHGHPHAQVLRKIPPEVRVRLSSRDGDLDLEE